MDGNSDAFNLVRERIKERTENRLQKAEERKARRQDNLSQFENLDLFYEQFNQMKDDLEQKIEMVAEDQQTDPKAAISSLNSQAQALQDFLNASSMFLPSFQRKKSQEHIDSLTKNIQGVSDKLQPKKKFGFKSKKAENVPKKFLSTTTSVKQSEANSAYVTDQIVQSTFHGFKNKTNETLIMEAEKMQNRQLTFQNLENCRIEALGNSGSLQIANLNNCIVLLGPTTRSAFIKDCSACKFVIACQQVRIHNTSNTDFYLHVTGAAIIEECSTIRFSPYNLKYKLLNDHYKQSGLSPEGNNWKNIDDFSWLNENEPSPNYSFIDPSEIVENWI